MADITRVAYRAAMASHRLGIDRRRVYWSIVLAAAPGFDKSLAALRRRRVFFVASTGRSGTTWLAKLLRLIPDACVTHEPVPDEGFAHAEATTRPELAAAYLRRYRIRDMALRARSSHTDVYGEVNGFLRRHLADLRELLPHAHVIHLVRAPRKVIPSVLHRPTFTKADRFHRDFRPPQQDLDPTRWEAMERFERICWLWAYENAYIRTHADSLARFEDMLKNYELFKTQILDPLGLHLDADLWKERVLRPENVTNERKPSFDNWTRDQEDTFRALCGEEMQIYGYE